MELNDFALENEELRERLGMDPKEQLDAGTIRHKKKVKEEQAMALNRVLTKEVLLFDIINHFSPLDHRFQIYKSA